MLPYTGDYIEHIYNNKNNSKYYTFTPRPLIYGDMYKMDDELSNLLIEAYRNIGFLEGLFKYAPNKYAFRELMLLKECAYSLMIDYDSPTFQDVLVNRGSGKGNIARIINLELAYKAAVNRTISAPDLSKLCGIALHGNAVDKMVNVRDEQTFLLGIRTNLKAYNPTAPKAVLPALADISAYLYKNQDTDPLVQAALAHYQFEMIHPFERYNGIVGRIIVPMILYKTTKEALSLMCLSEYLYHNKNEYFDLLRSTQYSGGYIRWIKFFVMAVRDATKWYSELLRQYEHIIIEDMNRLSSNGIYSKSVIAVYQYLHKFPVTSIAIAAEQTGFSYNTISKIFCTLQDNRILFLNSENRRNRLFEYRKLIDTLL